MFNDLYETLRGVLFQRWNERLQGILEGGKRAVVSKMTVEEAWTDAYTTAYFDAVSDMVDAGLVKDPAKMTPAPALPGMMLSDEIH
jgi:hypothetical protein